MLICQSIMSFYLTFFCCSMFKRFIQSTSRTRRIYPHNVSFKHRREATLSVHLQQKWGRASTNFSVTPTYCSMFKNVADITTGKRTSAFSHIQTNNLSNVTFSDADIHFLRPMYGREAKKFRIRSSEIFVQELEACQKVTKVYSWTIE